MTKRESNANTSARAVAPESSTKQSIDRETVKAEVRAEVEAEWRPSFDEAVRLKAEELTGNTRTELRETIIKELRAEFNEQGKAYVAKAQAAAKDGTKPKGAHVPVRYIGKRPTYKDGAYGTGISFIKGKSEFVPADKAPLLLTHKDVYEAGDASECGDVQAASTPKNDESNDPAQIQRDAISNMMDKDSLGNWTKINYGVDMDKRHSLHDLRAQAIGLIDQYGAV